MLTEVTELSEEELDALQSFCIIKIRRVLQQLISEQASGGKSRKQQRGFTSKASEASDLNCIVPHQLMNRIRLKNIRETIKQVLRVMVTVVVIWDDQLLQSTVCPRSLVFWLHLHLLFMEVFCILLDYVALLVLVLKVFQKAQATPCPQLSSL